MFCDAVPLLPNMLATGRVTLDIRSTTMSIPAQPSYPCTVRRAPKIRLRQTAGQGCAGQLWARVSHMILDWLQAWLGVVTVVQALLFWRCSNTAMPFAGHRLRAGGFSVESHCRLRSFYSFALNLVDLMPQCWCLNALPVYENGNGTCCSKAEQSFWVTVFLSLRVLKILLHW